MLNDVIPIGYDVPSLKLLSEGQSIGQLNRFRSNIMIMKFSHDFHSNTLQVKDTFSLEKNRIKLVPVSIRLRHEIVKRNGSTLSIISKNKMRSSFSFPEWLNIGWLSSISNRIQTSYGLTFLSYLNFGKLLILFNIYYFFIFAALLIIPQQFSVPFTSNTTLTSKNISFTEQMQDENTIPEEKEKLSIDWLIDLLSGTETLLGGLVFIGNYAPYVQFHRKFIYPLGFFYILIMTSYFISFLCFMCMKSKEIFAVYVSKGISNQRDNIGSRLFSMWDYTIRDRKSSVTKKGQIFDYILIEETNQQIRERITYMTMKQRYFLKLKRIAVNVFFLGVFFCNGFTIIYVQLNTIKSMTKLTAYPKVIYIQEKYLKLMYEYLPCLVVTLLGTIAQPVMLLITRFELYESESEQVIAMARILSLRLSSVFVFWCTSNYIHKCEFSNLCNQNSTNVSLEECWETSLGRQFYRLNITFIVYSMVNITIKYSFALMFFVLLRRLTWKGQVSIDFTDRFIDLIYLQVICLCGTFYSPFLPCLTGLGIAICLLHNGTMLLLVKTRLVPNPQTVNIRALLMIALICTSTLSIILLTQTLFFTKPSVSCGPFRGSKLPYIFIYDVVGYIFGTRYTKIGYQVTAFAIIISLLLVYFYYFNLTATYRILFIRFKRTTELVIRDKYIPYFDDAGPKSDDSNSQSPSLLYRGDRRRSKSSTNNIGKFSPLIDEKTQSLHSTPVMRTFRNSNLYQTHNNASQSDEYIMKLDETFFENAFSILQPKPCCGTSNSAVANNESRFEMATEKEEINSKCESLPV